MSTLTRADLWSLEQYAEERAAFRAQILDHKRARQLDLGPHARLYFEDALTMKYQIQEMLRVERIFEAAGIQEELDAYNPLIPDGRNWKATFMIEYPDVGERRDALNRLVDVEHHVFYRIGDGERVFAIANEDLDRSTEQKTAAVHFLRFELTDDAVAQLRDGAALSMGIQHPELDTVVRVDGAIRDSLLADLA